MKTPTPTMRTFLTDARYRRYLEASLALALADIGRDVQRRRRRAAGEDIKPTIPDGFVDVAATGTVTVTVRAFAGKVPARTTTRSRRSLRSLLNAADAAEHVS